MRNFILMLGGLILGGLLIGSLAGCSASPGEAEEPPAEIQAALESDAPYGIPTEAGPETVGPADDTGNGVKDDTTAFSPTARKAARFPLRQPMRFLI